MKQSQKNIEGIKFIKTDDYGFCQIETFSEEVKAIIRKHLSKICFGVAKIDTGKRIYSYKATLNEFIKRYELKPPTTQIGLIGELLTHILIIEFFPEYSIVSPYFNNEERSIKKGFDLVLTSNEHQDLWITEVKSGELHKNKSADETMSILLGKAKIDLVSRLSDESTSLWHNAINDAKIAMNNNDDLKSAVVDILESLGDKSIDQAITSKEINVFLTGMLFEKLSNDCIDQRKTKSKAIELSSSGDFNRVFILSVQKDTYKKVYDFLKEEGQTL